MIQTKKVYQLPHTTERYLNVFKRAGIFTKSTSFDFPAVNISENDINIATAFIQQFDKPFIAFAPFAKHATKTYPIHKSAQLIGSLAESYTILLLGGKEDTEQFNKWANTFKRTYSTVDLALTQQVALMSKMKAVISMDSANMHLAAIQGVPVISIWGATHPYFGFSGIGTQPSSWISSEDYIACRPCSVFGNKPCKNKIEPFACMNHIKNESILHAIKSITEST